MDHNIIPHNDTGQATHKYEKLQSDADEYLERVKNDPSFMKETVGLFNSRKKLIRCPEPPEPPTKKSAEAVAGYLTTIWREHPDILSTSLAGKLIGANRQYIRRQHMSGELKCISIRGDIFCLKKRFDRLHLHTRTIGLTSYNRRQGYFESSLKAKK